ncbi:MAG: putative bifunctional diguanylate cyclase/phosphodiesterase [Betaproteobacteria bacterium]
MSGELLASASTALLALASQPLRLSLAAALPWSAWFLALQVGQRLAGAGRTAHRGWLLPAALSVGAGLWVAALCQLRLLLDLPAGVVPDFLPALFALGAAMLCAALALHTTRVESALRRAAHAALFGLLAAALYLGWAVAIGDVALATAGLQRLAAPIGSLLLLAALQPLLLGLWCRQRREAAPRRTALVAAALAALAMLPVLVLALAVPELSDGRPRDAGGFGGMLAALAALLMGVAWGVVRLERGLLDKHERLNARLQQAHANLERTPFVDALTSLPNRVGMEGLLRAAADRAEAHNRSVALLFIGLDGFKSVNESYGHGFGDAVLREIALRLASAARESLGLPRTVLSTLARVGGDEFILMLQGEVDRRLLSRAAAQVLDVLTRPLEIDEREVSLSASVGLASFPEDSAASRLIAHADAAMQAAKHAGGSTYMFFEARMEDDARERMELLRDLRRAIDDKQLELFYQPKIDARSGQVTAAEALLRWQHPRRGIISPGVFIPIAERYGLIGALGNWVIEDACRQARVWRDKGLKMRVAINLSAFQMRQDDLVERIQAALKRHQIDPSRFTCEITESVAMEDTQVTQRTFERLGEAGIHLSIDDFGTGYSSLSYLRRLPASELKIDRSFVMDLGGSEDARAIVDAVLKLAHAIGLKVVAEGVETERQRDILLELGCDEFQGYLFARPMSARALLLWAMDDKPAQDHAFRPSLFGETRPALVSQLPAAALAEEVIDRIRLT